MTGRGDNMAKNNNVKGETNLRTSAVEKNNWKADTKVHTVTYLLNVNGILGNTLNKPISICKNGSFSNLCDLITGTYVLIRFVQLLLLFCSEMSNVIQRQAAAGARAPGTGSSDFGIISQESTVI
jgi:hypothetical protein